MSPLAVPPTERGSGRLTPNALPKRIIVNVKFQALVEMFVEIFEQLPPPMKKLVHLGFHLTIIINQEGTCIVNLRNHL